MTKRQSSQTQNHSGNASEETPEIYAIKKDGKETRFNRRDFIRVAALTAAGTALTGCEMPAGLFSTPTPTSTETPTPTNTPTETPTLTPTLTPTDTPTPSPTPIPEVVAKMDVNVRYGPSANTGLAGSLSKGDTITVIGRSADGYWYCVRKPGGEIGWVNAGVVDLVSGQPEQIPVVTPQPTPTVLPGRVGKTGPGQNGIDYTYTNEYGTTYSYTLPCGSPLPAGAVCVCNCVDVPCSCNSVCTCDTVCSCVGACYCDGASHYWYPN